MAAVRLRRTDGGARRQFRHELAGAAAVVLDIWVGALLAHSAVEGLSTVWPDTG